MIPNRNTTLITLAIAFIALYGIGMQPYLDLYLLIFTPEDGLLLFKIFVIFKALLALLILITSIQTAISRQIKIPFIILNVIYSLTVVLMNAFVIFGYQELNSFFYTDGMLKVRIFQQLAWIAILWVVFRKSHNERS